MTNLIRRLILLPARRWLRLDDGAVIEVGLPAAIAKFATKDLK